MVTVEQSEFIDMYIRGETISNISKRISKSRTTIYDWLKKDYVNEEIDQRKEEYIKSSKASILRDLTTYIENVKELANDKSDKRVALAANRYLIDKIISNNDSENDEKLEKNTELKWSDFDEFHIYK